MASTNDDLLQAIGSLMDDKLDAQEKRIKNELKAEMKKNKEELEKTITDVVGTLADNLDNVYAPKKTAEDVEHIREHLHVTP